MKTKKLIALCHNCLIQINSFKIGVVCDAVQMFEIPTENSNIFHLSAADTLDLILQCGSREFRKLASKSD